mgnify:CR=1 FL=1
MREKKSDSAPKPHAPCFGAADVLYTESERHIINKMPFTPLQNTAQMEQLKAQDGGVQFSHPLAEQVGWQLKAVFTLTNLYEDTNGEGYLHEMNIYSFLSAKAVK